MSEQQFSIFLSELIETRKALSRLADNMEAIRRNITTDVCEVSIKQ